MVKQRLCSNLSSKVPTKDMQSPPSPPLNFYPTFMKDAQCAENNEKSIFDFYFSNYREKLIENWGDDTTKMTITRKIKITKI